MIENPKVGQRVVRVWESGECQAATITRCYVMFSGMPRVVIEYDCGGSVDLCDNGGDTLFDSPASAAAALRSEAQRLIDAADKLESEARDAT